MRSSNAIARNVSAATIPPIEWPIKITRTEGSIVGEGVEAETSISITLFWSLGLVSATTKPDRVHVVPFSKASNTFFQVTSCVILGVDDRGDLDMRLESITDKVS